MSISTYAELQTALQNWLDHSGTEFTNRAAEFIALGEARLNRTLRLREAEQLATVTYGAGNTTARVAIPTGMAELLTLEIKKGTEADSEYRRMTQRPPSDFGAFRTSGGDPQNWCLRDQLELDRLVTENYTLRLHYLKRWDLATDATNWLLTNYPDIYLYASLLEAAPFLRDTELLPVWEARLAGAVAEANSRSDRSRDDGELLLPAEFSSAGGDSPGGGFDIVRGW